ncbi:MAG TPA: CAP domain-containing protein [Solirubrobacter sp.]|jgi:uncharacterized protein YkwD|nr:CAP domain-containing protein [Solirubrobacter sp.]
MRRIRQLVCSSLLAVTAVGAAPAAASAAGCAGADSTPAQLGSKAGQVTLCLLNRERAARGLRPLRANAKLARAARAHARDMVARHYFSHTSRSGASFATRIKRTGWTRSRRSYTVGENIGYGGGALASPRMMVDAWMHSAGHRANILARAFKQIGIGIANGAPTGGSGATYATDFGG